MTRVKLRNNRFFVVSALLISLFGIFNFTTLGDDIFHNYQASSDAIVKKTVVCQKLYGSDFYGGNMLLFNSGPAYRSASFMDNTSCPKQDLVPYASQLGLQAKLYGIAERHTSFSMERFISIAKVLSAVLLALTLGVFVVFIRKELGLFVATGTLLLILCSQWLLLFARSTYWQAFILFLPFVYTLLLYPKTSGYRAKTIWFFVGIGLLLFIKSLMGYEYLSTIVLSIVAAVLYHELRARPSIDKRLIVSLIKKGLLVFIASVIGFVAALCLNYIQLNSYYHDTERTKEAIVERIKVRTAAYSPRYYYDAVANFSYSAPELYSQISGYIDLDSILATTLVNPNEVGNKVQVLSAINYAFMPVLRSPVALSPLLSSLLGSFIVLTSIGIALSVQSLKRMPKKIKPHSPEATEKALVIAFLFSIIAPLSWIVLSRGHAIVHTHINGILFYIPTMLLFYALAMLWLKRALQNKTFSKAFRRIFTSK